MDDGARTLEDALAMVRMASEHGTTDLVATPHASPAYKFEPLVIAERLGQLKAACGGALRLYTGCDFHLSYDNIQDALLQPRKYTIAQKNYLLVEFSDLLIFHNTGEIFGRLLEGGMIPVITHPERNALLRLRLENIAEWVAAGARVQVTGQSLTGGFGRRAQAFAKELLDHGLVHVIASDGHDLEHRPPVMDQAYHWLEKEYNQTLAEILCIENPKATLSGDPMTSPDTTGSSSTSKWYQFWR